MGNAIMSLLPIAAVVAYVIYRNKAAQAAVQRGGTTPAASAPAGGDFPAACGYQGTGTSAQERYAAAMSGQPTDMNVVRELHGLAVRYYEFSGYEGATRVSHAWWKVQLAGTPAVRFQIADRSLTGAGKAVKDFFSRSTRAWQAQYPSSIAIGDADLDKRFLVNLPEGLDPALVRRVFATPGLKERLLICTEVDLCVTGTEVAFNDPSHTNENAARGDIYQYAARCNAGEPAEAYRIPVHNLIAEILVLVTSAIGATGAHARAA